MASPAATACSTSTARCPIGTGTPWAARTRLPACSRRSTAPHTRGVAPPETPDPSTSRTRTLVCTAGPGVLVAGLLFAIVGRVASTGGTAKSGKGDSLAGQFTVGSASQLGNSVDTSGAFLLPDPHGRSRDIFVQHLGGNQWVAFEARATGAP